MSSNVLFYSNTLYLISKFCSSTALTQMKNTFDHSFITEFCLSQSQASTQKPTWQPWKKPGACFTVHELQLKQLWFRIPSRHLSDRSTTHFVAVKGDIAHYMKQGFCTFSLKCRNRITFCWLSCNRICCNSKKGRLLSHLSTYGLSFHHCCAGLSQFGGKIFWWKEQIKNWVCQLGSRTLPALCGLIQYSSSCSSFLAFAVPLRWDEKYIWELINGEVCLLFTSRFQFVVCWSLRQKKKKCPGQSRAFVSTH